MFLKKTVSLKHRFFHCKGHIWTIGTSVFLIKATTFRGISGPRVGCFNWDLWLWGANDMHGATLQVKCTVLCPWDIPPGHASLRLGGVFSRVLTSQIGCSTNMTMFFSFHVLLGMHHEQLNLNKGTATELSDAPSYDPRLEQNPSPCGDLVPKHLSLDIKTRCCTMAKLV